MVTASDDFAALDRRRVELGMSRAVVARRANVPLPTVTRVLAGRVRNPRLRTIKDIAAALGVTLQLGDESDMSPDQLLEEQATRKARRIVWSVQGSMAIESQAVDPQKLESMVRKAVHSLLGGSRRSLWDD